MTAIPNQTQDMPNMLALDLSGGIAELALQANQQHHHAHGEAGRTHSTDLLPMLEQLLHRGGIAWEQLELFVLVTGPGSFTGLRIAAATIAGLNSKLQLPVLPLSALAVTALQSEITQPLYVCEDARAGECYLGHYQQGRALAEDRCLAWASLTGHMPPGAMFAARQEPPQPLPDYTQVPLRMPRGVAMLQLAAMQLAAIGPRDTLPRYPQPCYLQPSQAERHTGDH